MKIIKATKLLFIATAIWLVGCGQSPQNKVHLEPVKGMRMGSDYQKPGTPIRLQHDYDGSTELSTAEIITLKLLPSFNLDKVSIDVKTSSDSLVLSADSYSGPGDSSMAIVIPVTVSSDEAGKYYLNIAVSSENGGQHLSRSFALAVVVGDPPQEKSSQPSVIYGERVRILNAEETIN